MSATVLDDDARRHHDKLVEWALSDAGQAIIELDRYIVRTEGLRGFCPLAWHIIEGAKTFQSNWHLDAIFEYLEAVSKGEIKRLAIAVPPRCMKSVSSAIMWPAWDWVDNSWRRFLFSSYAHNLAIRDSVRCRRIVQSDWYQLRWGNRFKLVGDQNTKIRFENSNNGYRLSTSVDGQLTGEGGDIIVCFPADQEIATERGPMPIGEIVRRRMQIRVWSYDTATGRTALKPVTGWHKNPGRPIVRVTLGDGTSIRCTPDHQIWTTRGWVRADSLLPSDVLPRPTALDEKDGLLVDSIDARKLPVAAHRFHDFADLHFGEAGSGGCLPGGAIGLPPNTLGDAGPGFAATDLLDGHSADTITISQHGRRLCAGSDLPRLISVQDSAGPLLQQRERSMPLGVGDVLATCAVFKIVETNVAGVSVVVANLLPIPRWTDEGQHHDLMDIKRDRDTVAPGVEARVAIVGRGFDDPTSNVHGLPFAINRARLTADAAQVGYEVVGETGDRTPVLVEWIGHADDTFCLTVADYHTMMCFDSGKYIIVRNCDDPHNVREAESEATREATLTWWKEAMSSRLNDPKNGAYVLIQQRVHERDLMGYVTAKESEEEWTYLCLPMEFEPDHPHRWFRDPRKELGELLWPNRVGPREVRSLKTRLGPYAAAAQLQQRPAPREGGIFKRGWFKIVPMAPADTRWVRGWDLAATEKKLIKSDPDYTASALVGWSGSQRMWFIGHVERFREDPHEVESRLEQRAEVDGVRVQIQLPQDPGQAGKTQAQNLITKLSKFTVSAVPVTGDKMSRAMAWAGKAGAGLVALVRADWNDMFLDEVTGFPTAAHDDMVDAASAAFERLVNSSYGIGDWYEQMLRANGVDPSTLKPPHVLQAEEAARQAALKQEQQGPVETVSTDVADMMRSIYGNKPP